MNWDSPKDVPSTIEFQPTPENRAMLEQAAVESGKSIEAILNEILTVNRIEHTVEQLQAQRKHVHRTRKSVR